MNSELLTSSETNKLLEMIHALAISKNMESFRQVAFTLQDFIGCEHIIFGLPGDISNRNTSVVDLNISYPQQWVDLYQSREFWRIDPVVLAVMEQPGPQRWPNIYLRYPPNKKFLSLAHDFGMKDGYSCLSRGRSGHNWSIISMATAGDLTKRAAIIDYVLDRLSPHLHTALSELRKASEAEKITSVTKREKEVLKWIMHGKTSWEVSMILNIAEATINFHIQNIKNKFNVMTRSQAVAIALHHGLIEF